ncbi:MAG: DUF1508 domain-containing protein [Pseudodesulfovibrio sp.]
MTSCADDNGDIWEVYEDTAGSWRWRKRKGNGTVVLVSTQGFSHRSKCVDNAVCNGCPDDLS